MEFRQLRYFVRIVDLGSFTKAAAELFVAQPALSKQVRLLEEELGTLLLCRSVRGVEPTESGLIFYRHAYAVLRQIDRMAGEITQATGNPTGKVALGIPQSPAAVLVAPLVRAVSERYPGIQLQIREGVSGVLEDLVVNGRLDMSLLFDRTTTAPHLNAIPLLNESLYLVTPKTRKRQRGTVTLEEAATFAFALPNAANVTRQIIESAFSRKGLALNLLVEVDAIATMKSIVRSGVGATILSGSGLYEEKPVTDLTVRRIVDPELVRGVSLCFPDIAGLSMAAQAVLRLLPEVIGRLVSSGAWPGTVSNTIGDDMFHI